MQLSSIGIELDLDLADILQANIYLDHVWDQKQSNWLAYFASRSSVIVDAGAHVGYFTLLMGHYGGPDAAVHAFEPNPMSFRGLTRNIALNNLNATANPLAVTQAKGELQMHLPHRFLSGATRVGAMAHAHQTVNVNAISLDEYCQQNGLPGFDLIKMDIEGAEVQAILGMASGLRRGDYGVLFIELHASIISLAEAQSIYDDLYQAGYRLFDVLPDRLCPNLVARPGMDYHCCALSPYFYAELGSPSGDFLLPPGARLPFPVGAE